MSTTGLPNRVHRVGVVALLVLVAVAAGIWGDTSADRTPVQIPDQVDVDQIGAATFGTPSDTLRNRSIPVAARPGSASVTWFCGGAAARSTTLVLTNRSQHGRTARIIGRVTGGEPVTRQVELPGHSTQELPADFAGDEGTLAVTIEARHGGVVATQRVTGEDSTTTAGCATSTSESWYFAGGDTERGATETVALFNPFDELATADVTFLTEDGFRRPQATQGLAVPARSVVHVDISEVQDRRSAMGAAVTTRAGRIVAWRHQRFDGTGADLDGSEAARGVSLALGQPVPLTRFRLPGAVSGDGVTPRIVIANPGAETSTVQLHFSLDDPAENGEPPDTTVELLSGAVEVIEGDALRQVPDGVPFDVTGRVVDGGAVVAELWMDGTEPALGHGSFATTGTGVAAPSWVSPEGLADPVIDQLGLQAGRRDARVRLSWFAGEQRRESESVVTVTGGERVTVDLAELLGDDTGALVLIDSDEPVVASRLQTGADENGLVSTLAIPVAGGFTDP